MPFNSSTALCSRCFGPAGRGVATLPCTMCINVHISCCRVHFLCIGCRNQFANTEVCQRCGYCGNCCICDNAACVTCSRQARLCQVCYACSSCCQCSPRLSLNVLRGRSSRARWALDRARYAAERAAQQALRSADSQSVIFLPASQGNNEITLPIQTTNGFSLSESVVQAIYGCKPLLAGRNWVIKNAPYGFKENRSKRFLCPEIEVSQGNKTDATSLVETWLGQVVRDGSLPETGFEINLMPSQGDTYVQMIRSICSGLALSGAKVSDRCGLHVHVDARDFDYMDIRKLVLYYELIEPALFAMFPSKRRSNTYCVPCGFAYAQHIRNNEAIALDVPGGKKTKKLDLKKGIVDSVFGLDGKPSTRSKYGEGPSHTVRYRQMNLYSWYYRGSVEFRGSPGSIDSEYITDWSLVCAGLLDFSKQISERDISKLSPLLTDVIKDNKVDLYQAATKPGFVKQTVLTGDLLVESTRLLKLSCQKRCIPFIDSLQKQNASKPSKETKPATNLLHELNQLTASILANTSYSENEEEDF